MLQQPRFVMEIVRTKERTELYHALWTLHNIQYEATISEILITKMSVFCVVAPYWKVWVYQRFGDPYCLYRQGYIKV